MRFNVVTAAILLAILSGLIACDGGKKDKVTIVSENDQEMNAAMSKAVASVDYFIVNFMANSAGTKHYSVKVKCVDGEQVEFMWLENLKYADGKFTGEIDNDPELVKNVKIGDRVTVRKEEIADWMFMNNGEVVGAYTLHVLYKRMSPAEKKDFDKSFPYRLPANPKP